MTYPGAKPTAPRMKPWLPICPISRAVGPAGVAGGVALPAIGVAVVGGAEGNDGTGEADAGAGALAEGEADEAPVAGAELGETPEEETLDADGAALALGSDVSWTGAGWPEHATRQSASAVAPKCPIRFTSPPL